MTRKETNRLGELMVAYFNGWQFNREQGDTAKADRSFQLLTGIMHVLDQLGYFYKFEMNKEDNRAVGYSITKQVKH